VAKEKNVRPGLADMMSILGPSVVLRSENKEHYDEIVRHYQEIIQPQDMIESTLLKRLVDATWIVIRCGHHQAVTIERNIDQDLQTRLEKHKTAKADWQVQVDSLRRKGNTGTADGAETLRVLERKVTAAQATIDKIISESATEAQYNRVIERTIVVQQQLDRLITTSTKRFNEALKLFDDYRQGLGQRLRGAAEEMLKANGAQIDANNAGRTGSPSIVPSQSHGDSDVGAGDKLPDKLKVR
jgi:hypothetical protein